MFKLKIKTENAIFDERPELEIKRILLKLAERIEDIDRYQEEAGVIMDANGNRVGTWSFQR